jgi:GNAT superfamily N-acetyltransferase
MAVEDATAVAALAGELGYPATPHQIRARHAVLASTPERGAVLVAVDADGPADVIGWAHVELRDTLVAPATAQLMALIVADGARDRGVGRDLLRAAESWARDRGCEALIVATRVTRTGAHRFYRREGYDLDKTSHIFLKALGPAA